MISKKIIQLLEIGNEINGYTEEEIQQAERKIGFKLPEKLRSFYLKLGKNRKINFDYFLVPPNEFEIFQKKYLVFYMDNDQKYKWMISLEEITKHNPKVYRVTDDANLAISDIDIDSFLLKTAFLNIRSNYPHKIKITDPLQLFTLKKWMKMNSFYGPSAPNNFGKNKSSYYWNYKEMVIKLYYGEQGKTIAAEQWGKSLHEIEMFNKKSQNHMESRNREINHNRVPSSIHVEQVVIERWRQYEKVQIDFHHRLTIITGRNGSGKSTILNMISKFYGWEMDYIALPQRNESKKILEYLSGTWDPVSELAPNKIQQIGLIRFSDNQTSNLVVPTTLNSTLIKVAPTPFKPIKGLHIHSHRPLFNYQSINQVSTKVPSRGEIYKNYQNTIINNLRNRHGRSPSVFHILKSNLIALSIWGEGNSSVIPNEEAKATFFNFQEILKIVLPEKLGFKRIKIHMPEIVLETASGDFTMDSVSGGIASIIHIAWQIFLYAADQEEFVVTFDEPENHLHPALQKTLLPKLMQAFPYVQFIVVSHNKHIISSVKDCSIYVLDYNENNKVFSKKLDGLDNYRSSDDILNEALGMDE